MKELVTPNQVARAIGVSEASLKRWCDKGLIPAIRTPGGHRRLPINAVLQFVRSQGQTLVRPEVLGLPAGTGETAHTFELCVDQFRAALESGNEVQARQIAMNLYLSRHHIADICDRVIAPAFHALGNKWQHGELQVYQERRACAICTGILAMLRNSLEVPPPHAPLAIGGTLEYDPYTLPTTMVELALRESGWRAECHGPGNPANTLAAAIRDKRPALFWLSVSFYPDERTFLADYRNLSDAATETGTAVVVGGRALGEEARRRMAFAAYGDTLSHIVTFARALHPNARHNDKPRLESR